MDNTVETAAAEERVLATLPLRGISVFPDMLLNFDVERPMSIAALNAAMSSDQNIFLVAQRDMSVSTPTADSVSTGIPSQAASTLIKSSSSAASCAAPEVTALQAMTAPSPNGHPPPKLTTA